MVQTATSRSCWYVSCSPSALFYAGGTQTRPDFRFYGGGRTSGASDLMHSCGIVRNEDVGQRPSRLQPDASAGTDKHPGSRPGAYTTYPPDCVGEGDSSSHQT